MNWNDFESKSIVLDFYLLGIADAPYYTCQVTDMWANIVIGNYQRTFYIPSVDPYDNLALKV
jgi:hypothetical protein